MGEKEIRRKYLILKKWSIFTQSVLPTQIFLVTRVPKNIIICRLLTIFQGLLQFELLSSFLGYGLANKSPFSWLTLYPVIPLPPGGQYILWSPSRFIISQSKNLHSNPPDSIFLPLKQPWGAIKIIYNLGDNSQPTALFTSLHGFTHNWAKLARFRDWLLPTVGSL